ncbi:MAG TPA: hypothetical protein VGX37_12590, partial [Allosphingosinicella sp.]|nr:hypothetical protein [Allosphingosinicella sp.]
MLSRFIFGGVAAMSALVALPGAAEAGHRYDGYYGGRYDNGYYGGRHRYRPGDYYPIRRGYGYGYGRGYGRGYGGYGYGRGYGYGYGYGRGYANHGYRRGYYRCGDGTTGA